MDDQRTREVVLDTETTGLDPAAGHRIVEIGALEMVNHVPTGRTYHVYINPEREVDEDSTGVHGLTDEFLSDKPVFAAVVEEFLGFLADSPLVIHNAPFDLGFINAELSKLERETIPMERAVDTLAMARRKFPGSRVSLDALCGRYGIDNSHRELHGAMVDTDLLAEVYIELIGGRQPDLAFSDAAEPDGGPAGGVEPETGSARVIRPPREHAPSPEETAAHDAFVKTLNNPLWARTGT